MSAIQLAMKSFLVFMLNEVYNNRTCFERYILNLFIYTGRGCCGWRRRLAINRMRFH